MAGGGSPGVGRSSGSATPWRPSRDDGGVSRFAPSSWAARRRPASGGVRAAAGDRRVLLAGIVLVAIACRAAGAGHRLVLDEGYTWLVASAPSAHAFLDRLAAFENTPPLFYVLLTLLPLDHEAWVRLPALIAGVAAVPVLYAIVRPLAGCRAALLAALTLAVAPYQVATADLARGFTMATLGLLIAVWAAVRLAEADAGRWWWAYGLGAVLAIWSEYYAILTLIPIVAALLALRTRPAREVLIWGTAPLLTMIPWAWQLKRSLDLDGVTKVLPSSSGSGFRAIRDELVPLFFGEHGESAAGRGWELLALVAGIAWAVWVLRGNRRLLWLAGGVSGGTLLAHAAAAQAGPGVFERRYLSVLVPLVIGLLAAAVSSMRVGLLVRLTTAALLLVGVGVVVKRAAGDGEPDYQAVASAAARLRVGRVLTNSPVVEYYLRNSETVALDRPFGLGPGLVGRTRPPFAVVDDSQVGAGARPAPGALTAVGRITIRLVASAAP
jgi:hypothetical protein